MQTFARKSFNIKKVNNLEVSEQCQVTVSNRSTILESVDENVYISMAWKGVRENIKTFTKESLDYNELMQYEP
jgi:hypothetical protein